MKEQMIPLRVGSRYLRRNASRAMSGFVVRGLVELITNSRDSAYRLLTKGELSEGELSAHPIVVDYVTTRGSECFIVRDRFEGMTHDVMEERLLQYGDPASGFDSATVRGINARGAKDVGALGEVRFESICNGQYSTCIVVRGQRSKAVTSMPADDAIRSRVGIATGNGTIVTLRPFPETPKPRFDNLAADLARHVEIRYSAGTLPAVRIQLREMKNDQVRHDRQIERFKATGVLLADEEVALPAFDHFSDGLRVRISLRQSEESLRLGGSSITRLWKSEGGVLIGDGRTAHDIGFLGAEGSNSSAAELLFGELYLPHVPGLLLRYDEYERAKESDPSVPGDPLNPTQVTDPDRFGLNNEHPFIQAAYDAVRPTIAKTLAAVQKKLTPSTLR